MLLAGTEPCRGACVTEPCRAELCRAEPCRGAGNPHYDIIELLLQHSADMRVPYVDTEGNGAVKLQQEENTMLHWACATGDTGMVKLFLGMQKGAIDEEKRGARMVLRVAVDMALETCEDRLEPRMQMLHVVAHHFPYNVAIATDVCSMAHTVQTEQVAGLLIHHAKGIDGDLGLVLRAAVSHQQEWAVKLLLARDIGTNPDAADLHECYELGGTKILEVLLQAGAAPDVRNAQDQTIAERIVTEEAPTEGCRGLWMLHHLVDHGADTNHRVRPAPQCCGYKGMGPGTPHQPGMYWCLYKGVCTRGQEADTRAGHDCSCSYAGCWSHAQHFSCPFHADDPMPGCARDSSAAPRLHAGL